MDMNNGVNPAQSDSVRAELQVDCNTEKVLYHREPPPSYDASFKDVTTVPVTNQPVTTQPDTQRPVIVNLPLKSNPSIFNCPKCDQRIVTKVTYSSTNKTHMLAGFVCGMSCWCCLCCLAAIPYLTKVFKEAQHHCPNCNAFLGSYSRL